VIKNNRSAGNYFFVTSKEELTAQHLFAGGVFSGGLPPGANAMPGAMVSGGCVLGFPKGEHSAQTNQSAP